MLFTKSKMECMVARSIQTLCVFVSLLQTAKSVEERSVLAFGPTTSSV